MQFFLVPLFLATTAMAAQMGMSQTGDAYNFGYNTHDAGGHSRVESGHGGTVSGSYSYIDANGDQRTVQYTAGPQGFQATGDTGVDRKTAAAAAAMAALAPKAPPADAPAAPVAPASHPYPYGHHYGHHYAHQYGHHYGPYAHIEKHGYVAHW